MLWLMWLPIFDTVAVMLQRLAKKQSPFFPDRDHLHHLLQDFGMHSRTIALVATIVTLIGAAFACGLSFIGVSDSILFLAFIFWCVCILYLKIILKIP